MIPGCVLHWYIYHITTRKGKVCPCQYEMFEKSFVLWYYGLCVVNFQSYLENFLAQFSPSSMPKLSLMTLARGARQLVVQEALETTVRLLS